MAGERQNLSPIKQMKEQKTWLDSIYAPAPELDAVKEHREKIGDVTKKKNAIVKRRMELEQLEQKAWCRALDSLDMQDFEDYRKARDYKLSFHEAEKTLHEAGGHFMDALEGHYSGTEEILEPALILLEQRTAAALERFQTEEHGAQIKAGLAPSDSPSLDPIKTYLNELREAIASIPEWGDGNSQSVWRKFNHLVKP